MCSESITETSGRSMQDDVAIRIEGLSKRFAVYHTPLERLKHVIAPRRQKGWSEFRALDNVDLTIARGETCAIVGRNGSGKSTLLQILCGTLRGTSGRVEVNGRIAALLELGAGFNNDFTGRENVYMNGAVLGLSRAEIDARFADIEAFAEIGEFIDQPIKTYSSGMYVRLAFAVAIHVDPQILIVDEALAVGDSRFQAKCLNRIKSMQSDGVTILFVSHDVGAVRTLCDRALWLDQGKVRMLGDAFSVTAQYNQFLFETEDEHELQEKNDARLSEARCAEPARVADTASTEHAEASRTSDSGATVVANTDAAVELTAKHRPINHWGSHVGSILDAGIFNARGERLSTMMALDDIEIRVKVRPPAAANRATLSVAFSLKDLRGTDLIVSTTRDQRSLDFTQVDGTVLVRFRMKNRLNAGNYLLAVALEDRASVMPQYYEYIEGAHYFTSLTEHKLYGTFLADVEQTMDAGMPRCEYQHE
ncbi:ABC polysaccharide efflux pump, ATPase subunit [Paraburkholderia ribeironis]|uniref:ABC polysaccharide efflux pump, ATPase subunit n=1 Tax=Paraburkholderia ribeironis TaxID=1247936 RepID=A0A1N7S4P0_9BURK|nr:ABC transporter ATP-binding protein [Paraburkholderia ribeironis]SIT42337.1 ABC polysaccharide efflux pump, ATPase subunit [Paraburkholderia ribeironis]